jgi:hypothetical protein
MNAVCPSKILTAHRNNRNDLSAIFVWAQTTFNQDFRRLNSVARRRQTVIATKSPDNCHFSRGVHILRLINADIVATNPSVME